MNVMRIFAVAVTVIVAAPLRVVAETPTPAAYGTPISLIEARATIDRAIAESSMRGLKMAFAVVEPSGELVAFVRMEDAPYAATELAQQKARASARLRLATSELETRVQNGRLVLLSSDEVLAIGGGVPIVAEGRVIGAFGVSGGSAAQDTEMAVAALSPR